MKTYTEKDLRAFVSESNHIEGIEVVSESEFQASKHFLGLDKINIHDIQEFVWVCTGGANLRNRPGMNVVVGNHLPPPGGPNVVADLGDILSLVNLQIGVSDPFVVHNRYETLHPFQDGNGRSGRIIWAWQMLREKTYRFGLRLGFLHAWYYQTLMQRQNE